MVEDGGAAVGGNIAPLHQTHQKSKMVTKRRKKVSKPRNFVLDGNYCLYITGDNDIVMIEVL